MIDSINWYWLINWSIDWLADWLINWLIDWSNDWLTAWLNYWLTDSVDWYWLIDWLIDWLILIILLTNSSIFKTFKKKWFLQKLRITVHLIFCTFHRCRYGAAELHPVAAFMGGSAAQEVIKIVTKQFVPFNNTFIYNAMNASSATFRL